MPPHPDCPACRSPRHEAHGKRLAVYPFALVAIFGILFGSLHQASQPHQYTCRDCGHHFLRRSPHAKVARIILWACLGILLGGIGLAFMAL